MNDFALKLQVRTASGKQVVALHHTGDVPSVIYGHDIKDPILAQSPLNETTKVVHAAGKHSPVELTIDGKKQLAIIKSVDLDPVTHRVRHVAFHAIKQNEVIHAEVPVTLIGLGESPAERAGLIILQAIEHVEIKAKPADLPEAIEVSVADLTTTDDKLTIADIKLPTGVEFADAEQDLELVIANVYEPAALEAANEAAAGEAEEPTTDATEEETPAEESTESTEEK